MSRNRKNKKQSSFDSYVTASRRGSREASLEGATGFVGTHKTHKSKKSYSRKHYCVTTD
jgi:hypothetical protein